MLRSLGCPSIDDMAGHLGLEVLECIKIEKDLESIGVVRVKRYGSALREIQITEDDTIKDEGKKLLLYFARKTGLSASAQKSQAEVAKSIVGEVGYDAAAWMVDYILDVQKVDMYSLRFLESCLPNLIQKYNNYKQARERLKGANPIDTWDNVPLRPSVKAECDLSNLMTFGIILDDRRNNAEQTS